MYFVFPKIKSLLLLPIVCLFFIIPGNAFAQELKFSHITADQGLSVGVVNCVFQDSKGFMWFGTQDGLNKYDGYNITIFKHNPVDSNSLSNNFIYALYEDKNGVLWIGTNGGGLDEYNLSTQKFKHHPGKENNLNTLSNNTIRAILEDNEGLLWLGTDEGLNSYNRKTGNFTRYVHDQNNPHSISNNNAWCLHQSKDGRLWVGTSGGGLNSFNKKTGKFEHHIQAISNNDNLSRINNIRTIYEDKNGVFWIGTDGEGITLFDTKSNLFFKNIKLNPVEKNDLEKARVMSITKDNDDILWIATYGNGISLYNKKTGRFKNLTSDEKNSDALNNNQIKCIYHDKIGSVWIGTEGGGINAHFRGTGKFKYYKKRDDSENSLKNNIVLSLLEDRDGLLWIGTGHGGLTALDRKTDVYQQYPALSTSSNNSVLALFEDNEGIIWVGTWGGGLNSYDKKTKKITSYPIFKTSNSATILCIYQDKKGLIWVATYNSGIFVYDKLNKTFKNFTTENGLSSNTIYSFYEDSKNNMWIATDGGGVNKFDPLKNTFKAYMREEKNNSISSNSVNAVYEDGQGNIWLGTSNGLNKLNPGTEHFDQYFEKDGLPNDYIYCILSDKKGNLWMSTNKGVSKFNPLIKNENGAAFRNYDVNDGLQGLEFNQGAFFQNKKGDIFLGGTNGFNVFNPEKIQNNPNIPPVRIISYKRFGKEVSLDTAIYDKKYIELSWRDNFFSFDFAALDYQMPSKNKYSYKLEGVDDDWSPPSTQRYAGYTQLGGGDYIFRVRATNNDGVWNDTGATLYIRIIPPFWKTKWFFVLCIFIIIGGFAGFVTYRTSSIKRENRILEEKVEERTQELAQKNKDITSSIQYAKRIQLAILPPLQQIFNHFPESFVVYKPKDIVSGDFYWFGVKNGKKIIAIVDCTGHGVPGAFMSMIGHNLLNQIIIENGTTEPGLILNALHNGVQNALKQGSNVVDTSDGMDVALCTIDMEKNEIQYAGAYRPLFIVNKNKFEKIDATKHPIGGSQLDPDRQFINHTFKINKGDTIYLSSDGYADQFGGERGKKFMLKRFNELLISMQSQPMQEQGKTLDNNIETWRGNYQQVDDILVIGIRFS